MKRILMLLMAAMLLAAPADAKRSRYHKVKNHPVETIDQDTAGVVAYSDTTSLPKDSVAFDSIAAGNTYSRTVHFSLTDNDIRQLIEPLKALIGIGVVGTIIAIIGIVATIFFSIMPFVIFGLVVYLVVKHHNDRQRLAHAAIMSGQPIPQNLLKKETETDDEMWRRGLKNVFLGLGIAVFCYCLGASSIAGIGWLILICGVGQAVIAKTSTKSKGKIEHPQPDDSTPPPVPER